MQTSILSKATSKSFSAIYPKTDQYTVTKFINFFISQDQCPTRYKKKKKKKRQNKKKKGILGFWLKNDFERSLES